MADDVTLPGTGSVVATDDVGGRQFQAVKVDLGANGATSPLVRGQQSAGNSIPIVTPGDDFVSVFTSFVRPADTTAYAPGDALSDSTSAPTAGGFAFANAARVSGGSGIITDMIVSMSTSPAVSLVGELWIFDQAVTAINDNAAFAISDGVAQDLVGVVPFTTNKSGGNNAVCHVQNLNMGFTCNGSANLRFLVKALNAYVPASAEFLSVTAKILRF